MRTKRSLIACMVPLALVACGDPAPKQSAGASKPIRMACATPEQAGLKAQDITRKLAEARKAGTITQDEYVAFNATIGDGLRIWSERQDLRAYCGVLDRVVQDADLQ